MKNNVVLIGFMGVGKSAIGRILAKKMGYSFVDTDFLIEKKYQKSIKDIFQTEGEEAFRQKETKIIKEIAKKKNQIISTGGGVPTIEENMAYLKEDGIIISLVANVDTIYNRTNNEKRPLLKGKTDVERKVIISELLNSRRKYYQKADIIFSTDFATPLKNAENIFRYIKNSRKKV